MAETRQLTRFLAIALGLAVLGLVLPQIISGFFTEDAYVSEYVATLSPNGTLVEDFTYRINVGGKRFLYRNWDAPLVVSSVGYAHIQLVSVSNPPGTVAYIKDNKGIVHMLNDAQPYGSEYYTIDSMAYDNEAGAFNPNYYQPGTYRVVYVYKVRPPIEYDLNDWHLNLKLASEHIRYEKVYIKLTGVSYIEELYPHPPTLKRVDRNTGIVLEGSAAENELLEVEMLMTSNHQFSGFDEYVSDVRAKTVNANMGYSLQYYAASAVMWVNRLAGFAFPVLFYVLYRRFGEEKEFTVPTYLSTVPNPGRKPWLVNLIFKNDARDFDDDGLYATLLELNENKKIKITMTGKEDLVIELLDEEGLDKYEAKVMGFLRSLSVNGKVNTEHLRGLAKAVGKDETIALKVQRLQSVYSEITSWSDKSLSDSFTYNGRPKILPMVVISVILFFIPVVMLIGNPNVHSFLYAAMGLAVIPFIQSIMALVFPSTLFGRWKEDAYKEKLEWDAFKRHLSDFSQLQRYGAEDIRMWGTWLIYGTSLGVGEKVAQAMQELKIPYVPAAFTPVMYYMFLPITTAAIPSRGGSGGRGGGGGGGFGGGGGGVR